MWNLTESNGVPMPLRSRTDLGTVVAQNRLQCAAVAGRHFDCGCRVPPMKLFPVMTPGRRRWTLRNPPYENTGHAAGCSAGIELGDEAELGRDDGLLYTPSILFGVGDAAAENDAGGPLWDSSARGGAGRRYGTLTSLTHAYLMSATLTAFRAANPAPASYRDKNLVNPLETDVFADFLSLLGTPIFTNGQSVIEGSRDAGLQIWFGVMTLPLVTMSHRPEPTEKPIRFDALGFWGADGPAPRDLVYTLPREVGRAAGGKFYEFGRLISPPYFTLMTATADHTIVRLILVPVAAARGSFFGVESEPERKLALALARAGVAFLKLIVHADLALLGSRLWPCSTIDGRGWLPRRPDYLVISGCVTVVQLMGSGNKEYVEEVDRSMADLKAHLDHPAVRFETVELGEIEPQAVACTVDRLAKRSAFGGRPSGIASAGDVWNPQL